MGFVFVVVRCVCVLRYLLTRLSVVYLGGWVGVSCLFDIHRLRNMSTLFAVDYTLDVTMFAADHTLDVRF